MSTEIKYFKEIKVDLLMEPVTKSTKRKPNSFIRSAVKEKILLGDNILRLHPMTTKKKMHFYSFAIFDSNHGLVITHTDDKEFKFITNKTSQDLMGSFRVKSRMNRPLFSLRKVRQRGTQ